MTQTPRFSCLLVGHELLTIECGRLLVDAGHDIRAVVSTRAEVQSWAREAGLPILAGLRALSDAPQGADWLISAANLDILAPEHLALAAKGAINFHDGPLPRYAGLNAPVWALLHGETQHGVTWHMISEGIDTGDILATKNFEVLETDTALTLNARCFSAGVESFTQVIRALETGEPNTVAQDLTARSYFGRNARPPLGGLIDVTAPAEDILRLVQALDHGPYWNPIALPKLVVGEQTFLVRSAEPAMSEASPGEVVSLSKGSLTLGTGTTPLTLRGITDMMGQTALPRLAPGDRIARTKGQEAIAAAQGEAAPADTLWTKKLNALNPTSLGSETDEHGLIALPLEGDPARLRDGFAANVSALTGPDPVDLALVDSTAVPGATLPWRPVRFDPTLAWGQACEAFEAGLVATAANPPIAIDLPARLGFDAPLRLPQAALSENGPLIGAALTLELGAESAVLYADLARIPEADAHRMAARLEHLAALPDLSDAMDVGDLPLVPDTEKTLLLETWNDTQAPFEGETCIHQFFEQQAAKTPQAEALVFEDQVLSYSALEARANRVAHLLQSMGVGPGQPVGLHVRRGLDLVIGALGILKAGGAYLPLDPSYPADRIALFIEDSGTQVILSESALSLATDADVITIDTDPRLAAQPDSPVHSAVTSADLAYMIYTSGSTGRPKGVMIEHRNVANFFTGMDGRVAHEAGSVLLAVTSLSFDISVLELFWTLARGFKVVLSGEEKLVAGASAPAPQPSSAGAMDFSLFYWGNDDGVGRDKYGLLLEGAKFADQNGFAAIWTPERHFHAFGGLYPNPSVTGAAVAAVTQNIAVRAGSCVGPLHHPARIAEEWAVIDNLTNGRAGLAIASGWQPDDFVLRPENTPPNNKPAMAQTIDELRRLWAGEEVDYARADGTMVARLTQPRPVQKTLPLWVTTAGNPETWKDAGRMGANVLTHLLGQTVEEVGEKIKLYHAALREAGHDPADFTVTLMLHSFIAEDRETAREIAREPMKNYLRSAADLIKQYAWAFPAFKKPEGASTARELDLGGLEADEMEAILDFAFERYFERSGLFGTIEDAAARVDEVRAIGVGEIACLIDYGIERQVVLEGLRPLAQLVAQTNAQPVADYSLAAAIETHGVTHLQCTPYMARMLVANEASKAALGRISHFLIGGEPLSPGLIADIEAASDAKIENMYGPTETTIWSTTATVNGTANAQVSIGTPIANTQIYVLNELMEPVPAGAPGELYIGGQGVARGYWNRPDLTSERFLKDPFRPENRMFRTGDLVRWQSDGTLTFLGRADTQVKLRGYRIEPGEIEAVLETGPGVIEAVVIVREDSTGVGQLYGYVTGSGEEATLKAHLAARLPAFMVPNRVMVLEAMPLTPNKKIDRKALPQPGATAPAAPVRPEAPKTKEPTVTLDAAPALSSAELAKAIVAIWREFLHVDEIGPQDNFFDLGGHSLLAVEMHRAVRDRLGLKRLSIADIFRAPTLQGFMTRAVALAEPDALAPAKKAAPAPSLPAAERTPSLSTAQSLQGTSRALTQRRQTMRRSRTLH